MTLLKHPTHLSTRKISFFVASPRLNEFSKRQLQYNPSIDNLEKNYFELEKYLNTEKKIYNNDKLKSNFKLSEFYYNPNIDILKESFESINFKFLKNDSFSNNNKIDSNNKEEKLINNLKYFLYDSNIRNLYNYMKLNTLNYSLLNNKFSPFEISLIIKKIIYYNDSLDNRLKFITKNKLFYNKSNNEDYIKKMNAISRSVYLSSKTIFNSLIKSIKLSSFDYENIIEFYFKKNQLQKAIELIEIFENNCKIDPNNFKLSNKIWIYKFEILSQTNIKFWKIYGETIFKINSKNLKLLNNYNYSHHSHNFQQLIKRYEIDKILNNLSDNLSILNIIIKGFGKHGDIESLDKFIENNWGIKIDRLNNDKGIHLLSHFSINKNVNELLWPNEETLISILLAYTKNGYLSNAIEINNLLIDNYNKFNILDKLNLNKYWSLLIRCTGLFNDAINKKIMQQVKNEGIELIDSSGNSLIEINYRFFDNVWNLCEKYINNNLITRDLIEIKIKHSSSHELLKKLPKVYKNISKLNYNKMKINQKFNKFIINNYIRKCCTELASRGKFLDASMLIDKFVISNESKSELKEMLSEMQEDYARERVRKNELERRDNDDDNDFELW